MLTALKTVFGAMVASGTFFVSIAIYQLILTSTSFVTTNNDFGMALPNFPEISIVGYFIAVVFILFLGAMDYYAYCEITEKPKTFIFKVFK